MKLAELLIIRKAEKNNLVFLEGRLKANAKVQEGEKPQEDPHVILDKIFTSIGLIADQTKAINLANHKTVIAWEGGKIESLADALARRDALAKKRRVLTTALESITVKEPRFGRMEIKYIPVLNAEHLVEDIAFVSKQYADLEARIQRVNWTTDV